MGLASFNRARRERAAVEELEAARFKEWNERHNAARAVTDRMRGATEGDQEAVRDEELAAAQRIGEKAREGIRMGEEGGIIDLPLRRDHAAEIAGRTLENNQEPKDPVARVRERLAEGSATEQMVEHTQVDRPGPTPELVAAATLEQTPVQDREDVARVLVSEAERGDAQRERLLADKDARIAREQAAATARNDTADVEATSSAGSAAEGVKRAVQGVAGQDAGTSQGSEEGTGSAEGAGDAGTDASDAGTDAGSERGAPAAPAPKKSEAAAAAAKAAVASRLPAASKSAGAGKTPTSSSSKAASGRPAPKGRK